jgi:hypothetical protein
MLCVAAAVGLSRSFLGPGIGFCSRYVTISAPLLSALYVAWLAYGPAPSRWLVHVSLLTMVGLGVPANTNSCLRWGEQRRSVYLEVERDLKAQVPASRLMDQVCPVLVLERNSAYEGFKMLKAARIGMFKYFVDDRVASALVAPTSVR